MSHYYTKDDFDDYKESFKNEAESVIALMLIFNEALKAKNANIINQSPNSPEEIKFLFDAATELRYQADNLYNHKKGIADKDDCYTFYSKENYLQDMRNILKEEIQKAFFPSNKDD